MHKSYSTGDVALFAFAVNNSAGVGIDGSAAGWDVFDLGASAGAPAIASGSANLLSDSGAPPGAWRVLISTSAAYSANTDYGVFVTVNASGATPTAMIGTFDIGRNVQYVRDGVSAELVARSMASAGFWNAVSMSEPTSAPTWTSVNFAQGLSWILARGLNRHDQDSDSLEIFTSAGAAIASASAGDDGSTARRDQFFG